MNPLRNRILGALSLQPMTINCIARCLSVTPQTAQDSVSRLCRRGKVRRNGHARRKGYAPALFEVIR